MPGLAPWHMRIGAEEHARGGGGGGGGGGCVVVGAVSLCYQPRGGGGGGVVVGAVSLCYQPQNAGVDGLCCLRPCIQFLALLHALLVHAIVA